MIALSRRHHLHVAPPATPARRVLVVDDNPHTAENLATILRAHGHEAQTARDGPAALEAARKFRPDVILLDVGLAGPLNGYDLAPRLREMPGLESVLLVALTGPGGEEARRRALEAGFDARLGKPANLDALHALLGVGPSTLEFAAKGGAPLPQVA